MPLVNPDPFTNLPHANDLVYVNGVPLMVEVKGVPAPLRRWRAVVTATNAIIASTLPLARYRMLKDGFVHFQRAVLPAFRERSPFAFDAVEARVMFDAIAEYVRRYEWHLQLSLSLLYEQQRHTMSADLPTDEGPARDDNPMVERLEDGFIKRVS